METDENAIWSLFLAGGYLKAESCTFDEETGADLYELALTNKEVQIMFRKMIRKWFSRSGTVYNDFIRALTAGTKKEEASLEDTAEAVLKQIDERQYEAALRNRGIPERGIRKYGFAFEGKEVFIRNTK